MSFTYEKIRNWPFPDVEQTYNKKDVILYALGIGFGFNPVDPDELKFVYEKDLETFPTMAVVLGHPGPWMTNPDTGIDMSKVLHGEQHLRIHKPLPVEGTIIAQSKVIDVIDKGADKGALITLERKIFAKSSGDLLNEQQAIIFARGNGGFGGPKTAGPAPHPLPDRTPDHVCDIPTSTQAALLYRLSGDYNPLHADPALAQKVGFKAPILHGLASYGVAARALLKACAINDATHLKSFNLRFSSPVYPGETIRTEVWQDGNNLSFRARVVERDVVVLNHGNADLKRV